MAREQTTAPPLPSRTRPAPRRCLRLPWLATLCLLSACSNDGSGNGDAEPEPAPASPEPSPQPEPTPEPAEPSPEPATEPEMTTPAPEPSAEPSPEPAPVAAPDASAAGEPDDVPDAGPQPEMLTGVCGLRGQGTVNTESFEGWEERYIIGDRGFGVDVCVVRFELERVGAAPAGCVDLSEEPCLWAHEVEVVSAEVLTDEGGACANSTLMLDDGALEALVGTREAYGFVEEYVGHNSVFLAHDDASGTWIPSGNANWDSETGAFRFDRRDGNCSYQAVAE